jgi:GGDEF domain-containing protein
MAGIGDGIGCSVGVAVSRSDCPDVACALKRADEAMYVAKRGGKNRYHLYGAEDCALVRCLPAAAAAA